MDCNPPGSSVHGIFQARILWSEEKSLSHVRLFVTPWTVTPRLLGPWDFPGMNTGVGCIYFSMGSSQPRDWTRVSRIVGRRFTVWAYCGGLLFPSPRDFPDPEIEPLFPMLADRFFITEPPGKLQEASEYICLKALANQGTREAHRNPEWMLLDHLEGGHSPWSL